MWSSAVDEQRARRPTDAALLIAAAVVLGIDILSPPRGGPAGRALVDLLTNLTFLDWAWRTVDVVGIASIIAVFVVAAFHRRWTLCRDMLLTAAGAAVLVNLIHALYPAPRSSLLRVAVVTACLAVASPHLVRALRYVAHVLVFLVAAAAIARGGVNLCGALAGLCVGWISASSIHLVFGSPGGRPPLDRVVSALRSLGIDTTHLQPALLSDDGVAHLTGADDAGALVVKVFGRDAWSGQFFAAVWRFLAYRGPGDALALTRVQLAEHEALVSLIAARGGAAVPVPVVVAKAATNDVILAVRLGPSAPVPIDAETANAETVDAMWALVDALHAAGAVHRAIEPGCLARTTAGEVVFTDLSHAVLAADRRSQLIDRAQLMATAIALTNVDTAVDVLFAHRPEDAEALLRFLQRAVLPTTLRRQLKVAGIDLSEVRARIADRAGLEVPKLETIRRVSRKNIITTFIVGLAAMFIISTFSAVNWGDVRIALEDANWWWLVFAFVMAQAPRLGGSLSMLGACRTSLPYGPVVLLQYALPFIDVAAPAAAGRIAATMRFQQRYGVPAAAAFSASIIDSGAGFTAQLILLGVMFLFTDLNFASLGADRFEFDFRILLLIVVGLAVVITVLLLIPAIRRRVVPIMREVWTALTVLKSPSKFALLLGGSMLSELLYAVAMSLCLRSVGQDVSYGSILVVTASVRFIMGVSPIPGGVGIAEAGFTAGLIAAGVPVELAVPTALIYRLCTFYIPPAYGWAVLGVLRRRGYL